MNSASAGFDEAFFAASASTWLRGLAKGDFSAREAFDAVWERILARNPQINALAAYDYESAREQAAEADRSYARGAARPLEGLPITIKDSFETAGLLTACGDEALAEHIPRQDAAAVARLRAAGAIILAKTNVPRLTADFQTHNALFGVTCNPWDLALTPGGSSGGAAAAVAAGLSAFDLASDLGGSIRWPAQACGLFGLKPSWGRISLAGHIPPLPTVRLKNPPDLAVAGPLARSASDLGLVLSLTASAENAAPAARGKKPDDLRLALWLDPDFAPVDRDVEAGILLAAEVFRDAGAAVVEARPDFSFQDAFEIYVLLNFAIGFAGTPAEDRARFAAEAKSFATDDISYYALRARAAKMDAATFSRLTERRAAINAAFAEFFKDYDAILCPPAPCLAFPHDFAPDPFARRLPTSAGPLPYHDLLKWASLASLSLLPAVVAPVALTSAKGKDRVLPTGVQIICARDDDRTAVALAGLIEKATGGFRAPK
ncbi:amidase [Rhodoblastus acidophilus]|uniref:Amidase n=1 Tax=Candidatus Rhodoblastus alkanivorans TaxID=2954117 RepID=A0ABS9Z900_9HYPH|nr:amidase [Candidatus Rhodoblastus alkanivorans]MCI4684094.1 amidase [Candidatus Rhodoblastus alkanivorans]MDI4641414.1 amidase [Rhodoblastus acidophilus]